MCILRRLDPKGLIRDADFVARVELAPASSFCLTVDQYLFLSEERFHFSPGAHQVNQLEELTQRYVRGVD
jgi:hypothetical protein